MKDVKHICYKTYMLQNRSDQIRSDENKIVKGIDRGEYYVECAVLKEMLRVLYSWYCVLCVLSIVVC